jgi:hypothetical protein
MTIEAAKKSSRTLRVLYNLRLAEQPLNKDRDLSVEHVMICFGSVQAHGLQRDDR